MKELHVLKTRDYKSLPQLPLAVEVPESQSILNHEALRARSPYYPSYLPEFLRRKPDELTVADTQYLSRAAMLAGLNCIADHIMVTRPEQDLVVYYRGTYENAYNGRSTLLFGRALVQLLAERNRQVPLVDEYSRMGRTYPPGIMGDDWGLSGRQPIDRMQEWSSGGARCDLYLLAASPACREIGPYGRNNLFACYGIKSPIHVVGAHKIPDNFLANAGKDGLSNYIATPEITRMTRFCDPDGDLLAFLQSTTPITP